MSASVCRFVYEQASVFFMNQASNPEKTSKSNISVHCIPKDRTQLEKDLAEFLENGGKITELEYQCNQTEKEHLVRKGIFYTQQLPAVSRNTGIPPTRLKQLQRSLKLATRSEIETLFNYFKSREL